MELFRVSLLFFHVPTLFPENYGIENDGNRIKNVHRIFFSWEIKSNGSGICLYFPPILTDLSVVIHVLLPLSIGYPYLFYCCHMFSTCK